VIKAILNSGDCNALAKGAKQIRRQGFLRGHRGVVRVGVAGFASSRLKRFSPYQTGVLPGLGIEPAYPALTLPKFDGIAAYNFFGLLDCRAVVSAINTRRWSLERFAGI
jgi:hypothetical protein